MSSAWTEDGDATLCRLWILEGWTARQIGEEMGRRK